MKNLTNHPKWDEILFKCIKKGKVVLDEHFSIQNQMDES
jgi:hypothetical protein